MYQIILHKLYTKLIIVLLLYTILILVSFKVALYRVVEIVAWVRSSDTYGFKILKMCIMNLKGIFVLLNCLYTNAFDISYVRFPVPITHTCCSSWSTQFISRCTSEVDTASIQYWVCWASYCQTTVILRNGWLCTLNYMYTYKLKFNNKRTKVKLHSFFNMFT